MRERLNHVRTVIVNFLNHEAFIEADDVISGVGTAIAHAMEFSKLKMQGQMHE